MKISLPIWALRKGNKTELEVFKDAYKDSWEFARIMEGEKEYPDDHRLSFQLGEMNLKELDEVLSFTQRIKVDTRTMNQIQRWIEAANNPKDAPIPSVRGLKGMLMAIMDDNKYKWVFKESEDGFMLPHLVTSINYIPPSKYSVEHTEIKMMNGVYYNNEEFSTEDKASNETQSTSFYYNDIIDKPEITSTVEQSVDINNLYDFEDIEENDDDNDEIKDSSFRKKKLKEKESKPKLKKPNKTVLKMLADNNIFLPTDEWMNQFFEHAKKCYDISSKTGKQFICTGKAYSKESYSTRARVMNEEGNYYRLVVDMKGIPSAAERQHQAYFGQGLIPYHPYIRCYNLTKYAFCDVHAGLLEPYKYNEKIIDNMIVDDTLKQYLNMILGGQNIFTDIIKGKSGGMIVLASGEPGVGKTLTAEVYSEKMNLPLYSIQASQLGIDIDEIERELILALKRTERWGAVLLIDECDTYLRKRGGDLEQNAIVGIWLRLLEYFNGIMFLTTNLHDTIDDAILSRCSSHIKYEKPSKLNLKQIIKVHCKLQGIDVTEQQATNIASKYEMTGRDVRNLLKNIKKCYNKDGKIKLTVDKVESLKSFIPFINK